MTVLFEIRAKLTEIYQKYDFIFKTALKFLLMFLSLTRVAKAIGYNSTLSKGVVILGFSVFSAFLPPSLMVFVAAAYIFVQLMTASILIAITVVLIFLILYLFFLRFAPKEGIAVIGTPLLCSMGFPYIMPLFLGMFGSVLSIVPAVCGVAVFYLLRAVNNNIVTIEELKNAKDGALPFYINILDNLLKNPSMYVVMAVFAVTILTIVLIRSIQMDYSFEISLGVGTGILILGYIIGNLKYDMGIKIGGMIVGSLLCMGIVYVCLFFYRVLNYTGVEHVQFEDERYYYYVTAVPKVTDAYAKKLSRNRQQARKAKMASFSGTEEDDEIEAIEAMESMLAKKDGTNEDKLTVGLAKRLRKDVASKPKTNYDEDDEDEVVIKGPRTKDEAKDSFIKDGLGRMKGLFSRKTSMKSEEDELEEESEEDEERRKEQAYFAGIESDDEELSESKMQEQEDDTEANADDDYD